ncbi:hypothetical protein OCI51_25385 (plasmid) [Lysinibacillus capsici]|uniref:hypothetical protein n=1 Tax=Lysinibacillus capsici TaxID=2115968 RepID=UPI0021D8CD66|nr:hypothetical protein [Lysinibacillus capsici]UYB50010.1 hypothetical protein OCI51_25385 [Lysinibacillus capsici]
MRLFQVLFCTISKYKKAQFLALKLRNWAFIVAPEKRLLMEQKDLNSCYKKRINFELSPKVDPLTI